MDRLLRYPDSYRGASSSLPRRRRSLLSACNWRLHRGMLVPDLISAVDIVDSPYLSAT